MGRGSPKEKWASATPHCLGVVDACAIFESTWFPLDETVQEKHGEEARAAMFFQSHLESRHVPQLYVSM